MLPPLLLLLQVYRQANTEHVSYPEAVRRVVAEDGVLGLMGRGLGTKIFANGMVSQSVSMLMHRPEARASMVQHGAFTAARYGPWVTGGSLRRCCACSKACASACCGRSSTTPSSSPSRRRLRWLKQATMPPPWGAVGVRRERGPRVDEEDRRTCMMAAHTYAHTPDHDDRPKRTRMRERRDLLGGGARRVDHAKDFAIRDGDTRKHPSHT